MLFHLSCSVDFRNFDLLSDLSRNHSTINGAYVPWTTPAVLSGYLVGGWQGMVWQIIILALTTVLYWPFAKAYDNILLKEEAETEAGINAAE